MEIAQATFSSLSRIWKDQRLSQNMKIRLYSSSVCHTLIHACEAWDLTEDVQKFIRGLNNRCMHSITSQKYRKSAINPRYNLMLTIRKRRLRYLATSSGWMKIDLLEEHLPHM